MKIRFVTLVTVLTLLLFIVSPGIVESSAYASHNSSSTTLMRDSTVLPAHIPRNVLVSNCGGGNAEVEQAFDPIRGYIYEDWYGCGGIGFARSTDGGKSFDNAITVPGSNGNVFSWDPAIAVGPKGQVYVSFMASTDYPNAGTPVVVVSKDNGSTFGTPVNVMQPNSSEFSDRDFIAVAPNGVIYVTWDYAPNANEVQIGCASGGSCYFTAGDLNAVIVSSSDGGKTWSRISAISTNYPLGGSPAAPLLVEPSGQIDALYESYHTFANLTLGLGHNYFTTSTDGGKTWSKRVLVGGGQGRFILNTVWWIDGSIGRDSSGVLYASLDTQNGGRDTAWISFSSNDGKNWSDPKRVNPDIDSSPHIMVEVSGGQAGVAFVAWMSDATLGGWGTFLRAFSVATQTLSSARRISQGIGANGVWGGDTIGVTYLHKNVTAISWGYDISGNSEIYAATASLAPPVLS